MIEMAEIWKDRSDYQMRKSSYRSEGAIARDQLAAIKLLAVLGQHGLHECRIQVRLCLRATVFTFNTSTAQ